MSDTVKMAVISAIVSIVTAVISAYVTLDSKGGELEKASAGARSASSAASEAESATNKLLAQIEQVRRELSTVPQGPRTIYAENRAFIRSSETIPWDDTTPLSTEGVKVVSVDVVPESKNGCLLIQAVVHAVEEENDGNHIVVALFRDNDPEAIAASATEVYEDYGYANGLVASVPLVHAVKLTGEPKVRLTIRAGVDVGKINVNGGKGARRLGGALVSGLYVTEMPRCFD